MKKIALISFAFALLGCAETRHRTAGSPEPRYPPTAAARPAQPQAPAPSTPAAAPTQAAPVLPPEASTSSVEPAQAAASTFTASQASASPCFNTQYQFTCSIAANLVLTSEGTGPGQIMQFVQQSLTSREAGSLTIRAAPLGRMTLERYIDVRVTRDLQDAKGVAHWDKAPATIGAYDGFLVTVDRQYASGPFKSRVFGFAHGANVFLIDFSAPADLAQPEEPRHDDPLEQFVKSIVFQS